MSDQGTPQHREGDHAAGIAARDSERAAAEPVRPDVTEVAFPWGWALAGLLVVVLAIVIALVTESQGIGLR